MSNDQVTELCAGCGGPYDECDCPCGSITVTTKEKTMSDQLLPEPAMTATREQTMKELEPVKKAIIKVAKERSRNDQVKIADGCKNAVVVDQGSDQLFRYAELVGIPVFEGILDWENAGLPTPWIQVEIKGETRVMTYHNNANWVNPIEWTLSTYLGKLVIANAIMQSDRWKRLGYHIRNDSAGNVHIYKDGYNWWHKDATVVVCPALLDAVLAAVEEVLK